ncbi:hypothetical protein SANA_21040 [Gottschalkiaceae bacterium SANA]|nr:hypothetical protein SANA_21040 [Gottschalkiaceae bacterium SANA]
MAMTLTKEQRKEILKEWKINTLSKDKQIVALYEKVRDIPFGSIGSRDPYKVYQANKGTCSGKNFLIKELFNEIGVATKDMICLQRWKDLTWYPDDEYNVVELPDHLMKLFENNEIVDFHNYVKIYVDDKWVQLDVTIDAPLKALGFHVVENWDGKSDMPLCFVGTHKVWDCGDEGHLKKIEFTNMMPDGIEDARKYFLKSLTSWIDEWRANQ